MNIIGLAFRMSEAVAALVERIRGFYYAVLLMDHRCPGCGGTLRMIGESKCRCRSCGHELDPTVTFQNCPDCGGKAVLRIRRYECSQCGTEIRSRFLFDGLVFDTEYFRQKMAEHRERKAQQRERTQKMLAETRSEALDVPAADIGSSPELLEALNSLTSGLAAAFVRHPKDGFDLKRYESHLLAHIRDFPLEFDQIPYLEENTRKDRVWRFIALLFMAHSGQVNIWQDGLNIMVVKNETNGEGQGLPGNLEGADEFERPLGRVEA